MTNGLFICFEGGEGSGKSTQLKLLKRKLERYGILPVSIREPGGTGFGDKLREILMFSKEELTPEAELLLFNASRSQLVYKVISPALHEGKLVLCDRFSASTLAYQGYGRGISLKKVEGANNIATNGLAPDLNIFLDLSPEEGLNRLPPGRDRFEMQGIEEFHERVRFGYLALIEKDPSRWVVIDGLQTPEEISQIIWQIVEPMLHKIIRQDK
jgi:dTMP kinase